MSNAEAILEKLYPYRSIVRDMAEDMLDNVSQYNSSKLGRIANSNKNRIATSAMDICWQLERVFNDLERHDIPSLFEQDRRQIIETRVNEAAVETGRMTLADMVTLVNLKPHFYSYGNRRFGIINPDDGERSTPYDWVEDYWAPDYAKRFAGATMLGLMKEG